MGLRGAQRTRTQNRENHRTLISLGPVGSGSWSGEWDSLASECEVSGLLFCCRFLLLLNTQVGFELLRSSKL